MNTQHIEKFVNAIACDLEEGGFRQVSGTTLRRSLKEAVSAALPLLEAGNPVSELAEQQSVELPPMPDYARAAIHAEVEWLRKYRAAFVWAIQRTAYECTYQTDFIELVAKIDAMEKGNG